MHVDELKLSIKRYVRDHVDEITNLAALVGGGVVERENDATQLQFQLEELLPLIRRCISERRELSQCRRGAAHLGQALVAPARGACRSADAAGAAAAAGSRGGRLSILLLGEGVLVLLGYGEGLATFLLLLRRLGCRCRRVGGRGFGLLLK